MINPLKISEMLSQANQMQEEVQRKLGQAAAAVAAPLAGSMREAALNHPIVQRAREIFKAEVRSVVDLRQK